MKLRRPSSGSLAASVVTGALAIAVPIAMHVEHHHAWEVFPGFYAWYGALGCAAIVVVSKALGKWFLQKPEDWYD